MSIVTLLAQSAFDPEFLQTLVSAYEDDWKKVEQSGSAFASPRYRRAAQEIAERKQAFEGSRFFTGQTSCRPFARKP